MYPETNHRINHGLALIVSLALHGMVLGINPALDLLKEDPVADAVLIELLAERVEEDQVTVTPPARPEKSDRARSKPPESPEALNKAEAAKADIEVSPPKKSMQVERVTNDELPDPSDGITAEATIDLDESDTRYRTYLDRVRSAIDKSWKWKSALLAAGRPGSCLVGMTLSPEGSVSGVRIINSSGVEALDYEAAGAVARSLVPPFPGNWTIKRLHLTAQFEYLFD